MNNLIQSLIVLAIIVGASPKVVAQQCQQVRQHYAHYDAWQFVPAANQRRPDGSSAAPVQTTVVQPHSSSPSPTSVRYLNYIHYDPWSFVSPGEQRRADGSSPTGGFTREDPSAGASANASGAPRVDGLPHNPGGPQPTSVRQHYVHFNSWAYAHPDKTAQILPNKGSDSGGSDPQKVLPPSQARQYSAADLATPDATTTAPSYGSKLNF